MFAPPKNTTGFIDIFFGLSPSLSNSLSPHANFLPLQRSDIYSLLSHSCPKFIGSVSLPMQCVCVCGWVLHGQERCMTSSHVLKAFGLSNLQDATPHQPTLNCLLGKCAVSHGKYAAKHSKVRPSKRHRRDIKSRCQESARKSRDGSNHKEKFRTN